MMSLDRRTLLAGTAAATLITPRMGLAQATPASPPPS
jgi:hypothetical protein